LSVAQGTSSALRDLAQRSNFHIGAAVYTFHLDDPVHAETLSREFNMMTPENEAKFCQLQSSQGVFDFRKFDRLMAFAEQHKMVVRGHNLVWHECVPDWLEKGTFTQAEAIQLLRDHIMTVIGRYKGRIPIWDVVNEAEDNNGTGLRASPWKRLIGDNYVELAFRFAHEADPNALLFYNDFGAEGLGPKSNAVYAMMQDFVKRGIPVNGVGLQMHIGLGDTRPNYAVSPKSLGENIQRLGKLGLQVQVTEMDVKYRGDTTDKILLQQAADYRNVLDTCLNNQNCTAFVTWGVTDKFSWLHDPKSFDNPNVAPLLFDDNYQPKKAYYAIQDLLARRAGEKPILSDADVAAMQPTAAPQAVIPKPTKTDSAQLSPDSAPGLVYYAPFPLRITLDGDESDWKNVPRVTVTKGPTIPANNDTQLTFAAAADNTNLYFLADVKDSNIIYGKHDVATDWYKEDSVEFYINATGDLTLGEYKKGVSQIGILAANLTKPPMPIIGGINSADAHVKAVVVVKTSDGYRIEAAVPLVNDVWSIQPKNLGVLGFQVHLNGSSGDDRNLKMIWSQTDDQDQSYLNPSLFGQLIFWQVGEQQIEINHPQY
jgi:GH35 family endo-1,4-beta-xylanase